MNDWQWTAVDPIALVDRPNLTHTDVCFYYMTRDSRGFMASRANSLMDDFKKSIKQYGARPDVMAYKARAIRECAGYVTNFFADRSSLFGGSHVSLVPMPTSIPRGAEGRDSRLDILCKMVSDTIPWVEYNPSIDIRAEVLPSHAGGTRCVADLEKMFRIVSPITSLQSGGWIVLFDDILTTGAHYAACRNLITKVCLAQPQQPAIIGLFLALHTWV